MPKNVTLNCNYKDLKGDFLMKNLEKKVLEVNEKLPQLPENAKASLANFFWVLAVVSIVFNAIGIFTILSIGALSHLALSATGLGLLSIRIWVMIIAGVIGMGITIVMELFAVKPLKEKLYRGWAISFTVVWLQLIFTIVYDIVTHSFSGIFTSILGLCISLFLLAQVREYFTD